MFTVSFKAPPAGGGRAGPSSIGLQVKRCCCCCSTACFDGCQALICTCIIPRLQLAGETKHSGGSAVNLPSMSFTAACKCLLQTKQAVSLRISFHLPAIQPLKYCLILFSCSTGKSWPAPAVWKMLTDEMLCSQDRQAASCWSSLKVWMVDRQKSETTCECSSRF